jgi:hypothetical protein
MPARACPPPPTLSQFISDANAIVVARVAAIDVRTVTADDGAYDEAVATLEVLQSLKGPFNGSEPLHVVGLDRTIDSAAAPQIAVVFIGTPEGEGDLVAFESFDASDAAARFDYVAAIEDYLAVTAIADDVARARAEREWTVRCVESETLREYGVQDLSRIGYVYEAGENGYDESSDTIEALQIERLVSVLLSLDSPDGVYPLINYLAEYRDPRVVEHIAGWIEAGSMADRADRGWLMQQVAVQLDWTTGEWLASKFYDTESETQKNAIAAKFASMLASREELPEALAAAEEASRIEALENPDGDQAPVNDDLVDNPVVSVDELQIEPVPESESPQQ